EAAARAHDRGRVEPEGPPRVSFVVRRTDRHRQAFDAVVRSRLRDAQRIGPRAVGPALGPLPPPFILRLVAGLLRFSDDALSLFPVAQRLAVDTDLAADKGVAPSLHFAADDEQVAVDA